MDKTNLPLDSQDRLQPLVSVVMPCLNEEEAIGPCIQKILKVFADNSIDGEIVVSDNGSTDRSAEIARSMGARVVEQPLRGYGNAYIKGFSEARGKYFVMADADDTYDFFLMPQFLQKLEEGYDFVTGSRYAKGGDKNIVFLHRYIGNPALTLILNVLFGCTYTDVYCGYRAFKREAYQRIAPVSPGMEFNLELAINAQLAKLRIDEIPIKLAPRIGESKLHTFSDGWRSLRMMLLYCPNRVFMLPGMTLFVLGMVLHLLVLLKVLQYDGRALGVVTGMVATICSVVGFQILSLGLHTKTYSWTRRFDPDNQTLSSFYSFFKLETGLISGSLLLLTGAGILLGFVIHWLRSDLLPLHHPEWIPFGATLIIIGCGVVFSSLFISAMAMTKPTTPAPPVN